MAARACDVLLINAPVASRLAPDHRKIPLGIGYLAAVLRAHGISAQLLDAPMLEWNVARTLEYIHSIPVKVVGISALQAQARGVVGLAKGLRARGARVPIVLGGQFATFCYDRLLVDFPEIDVIVRGEGEVSFLALAQKLLAGEAWEDCPGIAFRRDGQVVLNQPPPLIADLDALPFPVRDAIPEVHSAGLAALISGSRGCPFQCSFCTVRNFYRLSEGPVWRARSPEGITEEIRYLAREQGVKQFVFTDDNPVGVGERGRAHARGMAEALIRANLGIEFVLACRVDDIEEELFRTLKRAGLTTVFLGVEAGNQRQLDTFNKRATVEANKQAIRTLRKIGIHPALGFIMADPYSTPAELVENVRFLKEMEIKLSELESPLGELLLFDGAAILEQVRAEGRLRGDYINGYSYVAVHRGFQTLYRAAARWRSLFHTPQARR